MAEGVDKNDVKQILMIIVGLVVVGGLGTLASSIGGVVWTIFCIVFMIVLLGVGLTVMGVFGSLKAKLGL